MPLSDYARGLREKVGHDLLLMPGVCGLVFNDAGEILLGRRSDNGRWAVIGGVASVMRVGNVMGVVTEVLQLNERSL